MVDLRELISFLPALLSRTAFRIGDNFFICSFDDSKVLTIINYMNKKYFEFEFKHSIDETGGRLRKHEELPECVFKNRQHFFKRRLFTK